jgi:hypothetical protein
MNKENLLEKLKENLPAEQNTEIEVKNSIEAIDKAIVNDTEEDYAFAREKLKTLLDKSDEAINIALGLASETESPRVIEVLGNLIKQSAESTERLLDLQKKRQELVGSGNKSANNQNGPSQTNVFIGDTSVLQKKLKNGELKNVTNSVQD